MSDTEMTGGDSVPPSATLLQMMTGYWITQALYVAAKLGVADLVADQAQSIQFLAAATRTNEGALRRVLRALASVGVFTEERPDFFAITPLAALLRTGTTDSMRALAVMYAEEQYRAWGDALYSVRTGETAFEKQFGASYFEYLATHSDADNVFNEAMSGYTTQLVDSLLASYDFSAFQTIVDVGGGNGTLMAALLQRHAEAHGILFDQPHVVGAAGEQLESANVAQRCKMIGGDFFVEVPVGGDAYVLAQILHDWDDEHSIQILQQCRRAIDPEGKLLVVELVLPSGEEPFIGKWLDLHMLVLLGGRERTATEYEALFRESGFAMDNVVPTAVGPSIVEGRPI